MFVGNDPRTTRGFVLHLFLGPLTSTHRIGKMPEAVQTFGKKVRRAVLLCAAACASSPASRDVARTAAQNGAGRGARRSSQLCKPPTASSGHEGSSRRVARQGDGAARRSGPGRKIRGGASGAPRGPPSPRARRGPMPSHCERRCCSRAGPARAGTEGLGPGAIAAQPLRGRRRPVQCPP